MHFLTPDSDVSTALPPAGERGRFARTTTETPSGWRERGTSGAPTLHDVLRQHPVFMGVDSSCIGAVVRAGIERTYGPGERLCTEGDAAEYYWLLISGSVRMFYASPAGLEVTVQMFGAPAAWGEVQLIHKQRQMENAVAVDRARVLQVPKAEFMTILRDFPDFMMNVLRDASARLLIATQYERALAFLGVRERLADLLMSYVRMYGVPVEGGQMIRIALSQADLARGLGVALKSVSRAFQDLLHDGVLEKRGNRYVVTNLGALQGVAPGVSGLDWSAGQTIAPSR